MPMTNKHGITYGEWYAKMIQGLSRGLRPFKYGGGTGPAWMAGDDPEDFRANLIAPVGRDVEARMERRAALDYYDFFDAQAAID